MDIFDSRAALAAWFGLTTFAFCQQPTPKPTYQDFEENIPSAWQSSSKTGLAISTERYKSGEKSLLWNWQSSDQTLEFRDPSVFVTQGKTVGFVLWVYNEKAVPAPMWAELLHEDKVVGRVWFWMEYQGWAPLGASYASLDCPPGTKIDTLRIHPPEGMPSGRLFIDVAQFNIGNVSQLNTYQMPAGTQKDRLTTPPRDLAYSSREVWRNRPYLGLPKHVSEITAEEAEGMKKLEERLLPRISRPAKGIDPKLLDELRAQMAEYRIRRQEGRITGRPVDEGSPLQPIDKINVWVYFKFCDRVKSAYEQAKDPAHQAELKQMFIDLAAHLLDQGWREGSRLRAFDNYPKGSTQSFLAMRDVLEEAGLARDIGVFLAWMKANQEEGSYLGKESYASMDGAGFWSNELVSYLLLIPDPAERLHRLRIAQRFYSQMLVNNHTIAPDGCCYHHGAFHFAYASYNLPRLVRTLQAMAGTEFRLGRDAHERLRTYAKAISFTLTGGVQPYNLPARAGAPISGNMAGFAQMLVPLGSPDGTYKEDPEMISLAYAQILDQGQAGQKALESEPMKTWIANGAKPMDMSGHMDLNGSPITVHRRPGWMVAISGMSKFWRGMEIYGWTQSNNYARFARNGSIAVVANGNPPNLHDSGWQQEGWNWSHFPGTTALLQPSSRLFEGYTMFSNGSATAGGTSLGEDGVWGMDFTGPNGIRFKQSVFCFGNRITVLKSNITSQSEDKAVTTLFQNHLQPGHETLVHSDGSEMKMPSTRALPEGRSRWLIDNQGTGYLLPKESPELRVQCQLQEWIYMIGKNLKNPKQNPFPSNNEYRWWSGGKGKDMAKLESHYTPTKGDFALGYFDHGVKPKDAGAAYTMFIQATPNVMRAAAAKPPFRILQQDSNVHALTDDPSRTTAYICFTANEVIGANGPLRGNSEPCFVMARQRSPNAEEMEISVVRPDIAQKGDIILDFSGSWDLVRDANAPAKVRCESGGLRTRIMITPDYYMPTAFSLRRMKQR